MGRRRIPVRVTSMSHLRRLGSEFRISLPTDEDDLTARECPACEGYFKIQVGTGLTGVNLPCHCPYCGHTSGHSEFFTPDQIEYAESVAGRLVMEAVLKDLKTWSSIIGHRAIASESASA